MKKEMSLSEFNKYKAEAAKKPLSPFAAFHQKLNGYDLFLNGNKVYKWEVFIMGYRNAGFILSGASKIQCIKREKKS